ncbi:hypothetical protein [Thermaerobacillus caldiproteolyticus]|uniref:hypothetical protein n=1 Tax=Thermaerobacillus caldiproteolyticus TaxID=247480 RepID=UPI00188A56CF|nr:hypothetical protein [Anoxybacillus caldiproteolyticus]QPA30647.1 hypothetical protein ISX45_13850 [Anoxybacillus caldiproteolyticus]
MKWEFKRDIALGFQDSGMELAGWLELIRTIIRQYSFGLDSLRITVEALIECAKRFGPRDYRG